jgi:acetoin utilization deacetylase AcuC-like enzyme
MLSSESYRYFTKVLCEAAQRNCDERIIFAHEGGYSKDYVPFCGLAVIEELSGHKTEVEDSLLSEINTWGYQDLQLHQKLVVDKVARVQNLTSTADDGTADLSETEQLAVLSMKSALETIDLSRRAQVLALVQGK